MMRADRKGLLLKIAAWNVERLKRRRRIGEWNTDKRLSDHEGIVIETA